MTKLLLTALVAAGLLVPAHLAAQDRYPTRPVRIVAPFPPGASTDLVARSVGQVLAGSLGVSIVVDNRSGAGGMLGSDHVAKEKPDGYTIGVALNATHGLNSFFTKKMPYDAFRDFIYIAAAAEAPTAFVVHKSVPGKTMAEVLDWARKNPEKLSIGSSGVGSHHHLGIELLKQKTSIPFKHVPYRGGGPAMTDLIAGHIPMLFTTMSTAVSQMGGGNLKLIALEDDKRVPAYPDIPTIGESVPGFYVPGLFIGFVGPAGLPEPIVTRLNTEINKALRTPDVTRIFNQNTFVTMTMSPSETRKRFEQDKEAFGKIVDLVGIKPPE